MATAVTLGSLNSGAISDLFEESLGQVLENIGDDNTKSDAERKIPIEISFKPNKNRSFAETKILVKTKLASIRPHEGSVALSFDGRTISAYTDDPKQTELAGLTNITPMKEVVNG